MLQRVIRHLLSTPTRRLVAMLGLSSSVALTLLLFRAYYAGRHGYFSLPWDLFLAWMPLPLAFAVLRLQERGTSGLFTGFKLIALSALWLLFFPNAPYLLTEFMHLHPSYAVSDGPLPLGLAAYCRKAEIPLWFDVMMLSTYAWTGLLLGYLSLYLIHRAARRLVGRACGWAVVVAGVALGAFGISLGRFQRWNSWDLFAQPTVLLSDVFQRLTNPFAHPRTTGVTIVLATFLLLGYLSLVALMRVHATDEAGHTPASNAG